VRLTPHLGITLKAEFDLFFLLFKPKQSTLVLAFTYPSLMWQGIAWMYHKHLLFHTLPQLSTTVATHIHCYFKLCHTVLSSTRDLPAFADADHFLGYILCPPSVQDWHRRLELPVFTTAMPPFPELRKYSVLPINLSSNYSGVTLSPLPDDEVALMAPAARAAGAPRLNRHR